MKKREFFNLLYSIFLLIILSSPAYLESLEKGVESKTSFKRIISLGPSITEQIYLLDAEDKLVGCTIYCKRPKDAESKEKVGTAIEVNLEKIITLKPDLVLATSLIPPKTIEKLKDLKIRVVSFPSPKSFDEICEQFLSLGVLVGEKGKAEKIIEEAKKKVNEIKEKVKVFSKPKVLVQVGAKPLWVATKDSFINDFIEFAGGENLGPERNGIYSREKVLKQNPDIIIITTMGIMGENEKKLWQRYKPINAVKNNKIYIIDSYKLCSPTPVSFVQTLKELVGILHLDLKE